MDPRIRQRRVDVQRAAGRRRLRMLVGAAAVVASGFGVYGLTRSPLLDVEAVKVRGLHHTTAGQVVGAAGLDAPRQMSDVDVRAVGARVEALPWVRRATVRRDWPGAVEISVVEREAAAVVVAPSGQHFAYLDETGQVLGHAPGGGHDLAVIAGVAEVPAPGHHLDGAEVALAVLRAVDDHPSVAEVHLRGVFVDVVLAEGTVVVFGEQQTELRDKVVALRTIAGRVDLTEVAVIDLRVPSAPALTRR